jgi:hypothetical protein
MKKLEFRSARWKLIDTFRNLSDQEICDYLQSMTEDDAQQLVNILSLINMKNTPAWEYDIFEKVEDGIYKVRFGAFHKLIRPGLYLADRQKIVFMRQVVETAERIKSLISSDRNKAWDLSRGTMDRVEK